jgi:hypothetical protein
LDASFSNASDIAITGKILGKKLFLSIQKRGFRFEKISKVMN